MERSGYRRFVTIHAYSGTEWIVPSNPATYDAVDACDSLTEINWSESTSAKIANGEVVYLYVTRPTQALTHRCLVVDSGISFDRRVDDDRFWVDQDALQERRTRSWLRLRLLPTFDPGERGRLSLRALMTSGLKSAPQGRMRAPATVSTLINMVSVGASG